MSEMVAWDADGHLVDPDSPDAVGAEYTDEDGIRHYLTKARLPDLDDSDSDDIDRIITGPPAAWDQPFTDLASLIEFLGGEGTDPEVMADRVAAVMLLPSWPNAPESLRSQVQAYLAG